MDPVNNEVNTENVKTRENVKTKHYSRVGEDVNNNIKSVSFKEQ